MNESAAVLYTDSDYFSPYALSVFVTLEEKGIPFLMQAVDLNTGQHLRSDYAAKSVTWRVPTLEVDDFALSESTAIIEYLEEVYTTPDYPSVFPGDTRLRARARQIQAWLRTDLAPLRQERPTAVLFASRTDEPLSQLAQRAAKKLISIADRLIHDGNDYLFRAWCIADTELALMLNRLVANGDPVPDKLRHYVDRQWSRPAIQKWLSLSNAVEHDRMAL